MSKDHHSDIFTIGIGGAAGDGVREAGLNLGQLLCELGYEVYISNTYPSLIRGGHNFTRISFAKEKVWTDHAKLDVLIALNEESIGFHRAEFDKETVILAETFEENDLKSIGNNAVTVPLIASTKQLSAPLITRNSVALGAVCYLLDLDLKLMHRILGEVFKNKMPEVNIKLAEVGYEHLKKIDFRHPKKIVPAKQKKELVDGNEAFGRGLLAAGLNFYVGYPMTPVTGLLHFLASRSLGEGNLIEPEASSESDGSSESEDLRAERPSGVRVIQPESELAVINMALGISYAGKRVAVGSATGGFMLMEEAFSMAGIAELPLVVAVAERQAPATGVPTYSSQTDLRLAIHSGHGEFPRIVLIPGDPEECFLFGGLAMNLAWEYQLPVIVLLDKILCENSMTSLLLADQIKVEPALMSQKTGPEYGRYEITSDGISPMAFPGTPKTVVKITSYEHDSMGLTAEEAEPVRTMIDKRFKKGETLLRELEKQETVKVYGDKESKDIIVFWGSTKGPVLEAIKYIDKPVKLLQIIWAEPFNSKKVTQELKDARNIINIECNHNAQMAALIREKTGIEVTHNILKYDSRPFEVVKLAEEIAKVL